MIGHRWNAVTVACRRRRRAGGDRRSGQRTGLCGQGGSRPGIRNRQGVRDRASAFFLLLSADNLNTKLFNLAGNSLFQKKSALRALEESARQGSAPSAPLSAR